MDYNEYYNNFYTIPRTAKYLNINMNKIEYLIRNNVINIIKLKADKYHRPLKLITKTEFDNFALRL